MSAPQRPDGPTEEAAQPPAYVVGDRIAGKYKLLRPLGEGGMGVVWVAHNLGLDVHVALKLLRPELSATGASERLIREARAAARLDHPAIVRILDVGHSDRGEPFLAMELLDGETLAQALERSKRFDAITAVRLMLPIAGALAAMHRKGMVHRDIKPENIFLAQGDAGVWQPKLLDFGLAKHVEASKVDQLTRRGVVLGSPGYIAPEVLAGDEADAQTDVWSLCVVLYELVTGVRPYGLDPGSVRDLVMLMHPPEPIMQRGGGDAELWAILRRGFQERLERWPTMDDLGKALAGWLMARDVAHDIAGFSLRPAWLGAEVSASSDAPPRPSSPARSSRPSNAPLSFRPTELDLRPTPRASSRPAALIVEVEPRPASASARPAERAPLSVSPRDRTAPPVATRDTVAPARASSDTLLRVVMLSLTALLLIAAGLVASGKLGRSEPAPPPQAASGPSVSVAPSAPPPATSEAPPSSAAPARSAALPAKQAGASSPRGASSSGLKDPFH